LLICNAGITVGPVTSAALDGINVVEGVRRPWAGDPPQAAAARRRLLDAAARCIARDGLAATSVASVAAEAGVSRPTVYRYFEDRDALVRGALGEAAIRLHAAIDERTTVLDDAGDIVVEVVVHALATVQADPVLSAIWSSAAADGSVVGRFTEPGGVAFARSCLIRAADLAGWSDPDADEAAELVLRVALSLLVSPEPRRSRAALRAFLRRRLLPALGLPATRTAASRTERRTGGSP
jgi:AcrR family transcriptional regulator